MITDNFYNNQLAECGLLKLAVLKYSYWTADFLSKLLKISINTINYYRKYKIEYPEPDVSGKFIRINYSHLHLLNSKDMKMDLIDYGVVSLLDNYNKEHENTFVYEDTMAKVLHTSKKNVISALTMAKDYGLIRLGKKGKMITKTVSDLWKYTETQTYGSKDNPKFDLLDSLRPPQPELPSIETLVNSIAETNQVLFS